MRAIEISNRQNRLEFDKARLSRAVDTILRDAGVEQAELSIAVVDDPTIHQLNRTYLAHDYATDVLSFVLDRQASRLEGEIVVSADTAVRAADQFGWTGEDELLLYVIHGALHLVGFEDDTPAASDAMRLEEQRYLALFGLQAPIKPIA